MLGSSAIIIQYEELENATFVLLHQNSTSFAKQLMLSLKHGAIPLIIHNSNDESTIFPFGNVIDWKRVAIEAHHSLLQAWTCFNCTGVF